MKNSPVIAVNVMTSQISQSNLSGQTHFCLIKYSTKYKDTHMKLMTSDCSDEQLCGVDR